MNDKEPSKTLWMGDLEPYMDEFFILQAFETMGEPASQVKLIHNKFSGTGEDDDFHKIYGQEREVKARVGYKYPELRLPAGYCFVDFLDPDKAQKAMLRLNGKIIPNSQPPHRFKLNCNNIRENSQKKEFSLFVGELSTDVDDYELYQAFSKKYVSCHTAKVVLDGKGMSKGYGFVRFSEETDQQRALIEMQHQSGIGRRPVRISLATPKKVQNNQPMPPGPPPPNQYNNHGHGPPGPGGPGGFYPPNQGPNYNKMYEDYTAYYQQYYANYYASQQQQQAMPQMPQFTTPPPPLPSTTATTAATATTSTTPAANPPPLPSAQNYVAPEDDANALEEPELEIDVDKFNREYMAQSEEVFDLLEDSRWHPMDQWNSTVPATAR